MGNDFGGGPGLKSGRGLLALVLAIGASLLTGKGVQATDPGHLTIHADQPGVTMSPSFYGLMTEEINHAYDGGIYGELIQNRIFADAAGGRRWRGGAAAGATPSNGAPSHWSIVSSDGAQGKIELDTTDPVNTTALTTSLRLDITNIAGGQRVGVANNGFYGIPSFRILSTQHLSMRRQALIFPGLSRSISKAKTAPPHSPLLK